MLAALLAGGTALGLVYVGAGHGRSAPRTVRPAHPRARETTTQPAPALTPDGTYLVTTTTLDAGTTGAPAGTPGAHLATTVWFPASPTSAGSMLPDRAHGPYPLLVFSQGYGVAPQQYDVLLTAWASAGFVVAAPTYPHTDDSQPAFLDESDIVNHPAELRTVIGTVLTVASRPGSDLSGLVDASEVGLVGQSDGGDVSLAVAADSCCRYPAVKAVAILSGAELSSFGGQYFASPTPPILVVQGSADTINPPDCSVHIYDAAPRPKWYLDLLTAPHLTPYTDADAYERVVAVVTTDFFDAELARQPAGLGAMAAGGTVTGVAQMSDGATAPPAPGGCPGAP